MLSECARVTMPEEARYRVDYPNSLPRRVKVIALDATADALIRALARKLWNGARFMTVAKEGRAASVHDWLRALDGATLTLLDEVSAADAVVTVSTAGQNSEDAAVIAEACNLHRVMLTSLVIDPPAVTDASLLKTMMPLRATASMLVVARGEDYVEAMLAALRA